MRLLIVDDDLRLARALKQGLEAEGYIVDLAATHDGALRRSDCVGYDAFVLDVMLPGGDGFALCEALRSQGTWAPVLMLTARDGVDDRVRGLDAGADDYLVKPFSFAELAARLRALARRAAPERPTVLRVGDLVLDPAALTATRLGFEIELTTKEFAILEVLMRRPGQVVSRIQLIELAWDLAAEHRSNVIDVYIRYLREKIDRPFGLSTIETVRGAGYRFRKPAAE